MFEGLPADTIEARTALRAALARAEIRHMAMRALDDIDAMLGFAPARPDSYYARSLGQLRRFARERATTGELK